MVRCRGLSLLLVLSLVPFTAVVSSSALAAPSQAPVPVAESVDGLVVPELDPQPVAALSEPSSGDMLGVSERSLTVANADGSFTTTVSAAPLNMLGSDGWSPVDTDLAIADNGEVLVAQDTPTAVEIPAEISAGDIEIADADASVGFSLERPNEAGPVEAVVEGGAATFADALPGVDVVYEVLPNGVKETLVLESLAAGSVFRFPVRVRAGFSLAVVDDSVVVADSAGVVRFTFLPAFMDDSAGAHSDAVVMSLDGDTIVLTADEEWLSDPERVWPVLLDPTLTSNDPGIDCSLWQSQPTTTHCADANLRLGSQGAGQVSRVLLDWNLESVFDEPVTVTSASLQVSVQSQVAGSTPLSVDVHNLTQWFGTQATWNNRTSTDAWTTAGGGYDPAVIASDPTVGAPGSGADVAVFDVTGLVVPQVERQVSSHGMLLKASSESVTNAVNVFSEHASDPAKRPTLTINWQPLQGKRSFWQYVEFGLADRASLAVNVASGNLVFTSADVNVAGTGLGAAASRTYNSRSTTTGPFGVGWSSSLEPRLTATGANVTISAETTLAFIGDGAGGYIAPPGANSALTGNSSLGWTLIANNSGDKLVFSTAGLLTRREDRNGNQINLTYTSARLTGLTDTQNRVFTVNRVMGDTVKVASISDPLGRQFDYTYTSGRLTGYTAPAVGGATRPQWAYGYDGSGRLSSITNPRGVVATVGYDSRDRVTSVTQAAGTGDQVVFTFAYDNTTDPLTTTVTDPRSQNTVYRFDRRGQVTRVVDQRGNLRDLSYSPNGDVGAFNGTNAVSGVTQLAYDNFNNLTSTTAPASGSGQTAATTALTWNTTAAPYLATSQKDPSGNCSTFGYYQNNPTTITTGAAAGTGGCNTATGGNTITQVYDGQPKSGGGTWECSTKNTRQLCATIDANANTTLYTYDTQGNLTTITPPAPLGATSIVVDAISRPVTVTNGNGQITRYSYDAEDRVTRITYNNDTTCASTTTCTTFTYDSVGNLTSRVDNTGTTNFTYTLRNQPNSKVLPGNANACAGYSGMQFRYDGNNSLTSVCDTGGSTVYRYNWANELISIQEPGANCAATPVTGACTKIGYENSAGVYQDGRRATMTLPPSTGVVVTYTYDNAGNLLSNIAKKAAATLSTAAYTYTIGTDDTNLRRSYNNGASTLRYGYDTNNQLCFATTSATAGTCATPPTGASRWVYDPAGNRTQQTVGSTVTNYGYNAANQLCNHGTGTITCPSSTYTYDANGNTTKTPTITNLAYNAKDQNTARTQTGVTTNFTYADVGQTERTSNGATTQISDILGLSTETNTRYIRDTNGTPIGQRLTGTGAGNYYYLTDALGSTTHIINNSGAVVRTYTYDPWGNTTTGAGTVNSNIRFATGYSDPNGLTKFGARYYNPTTGRWTQQDPAGNIDGPNRYLYVNNNPTNATDPTGYFSIGDIAGDVIDGAVQGFTGGFAAGASLGCVLGFVSGGGPPGCAVGFGVIGAIGGTAGFTVGGLVGGFFGDR